MKFRAEHHYPGISLPEYEALHYDEPFNIALCAAVKLERTVLKNERAGATLTRVVKVSPDRTLPGPVAKVVGAKKIEYTEHTEYGWGTYRGRWHVDSSLMPDKIECKGTIGFTARDGGVARWVEGEVNVKLFGLGGIVERFIIADTEKSYADAAAFTRRWIAEQGAASAVKP